MCCHFRFGSLIKLQDKQSVAVALELHWIICYDMLRKLSVQVLSPLIDNTA
jgi:hypothetical protein